MRQINLKKMLTSLVLSSTLGSALIAAPSLVNGIALFVNGSPITLLELYSTAQEAKVTQDVAIDILINKKLHEDEIKKRNIDVNELEINEEIAALAKKNKATIEQVKAYVESNGGNFEAYKKEIKERLLKQKLYQSITQENLKNLDERELMDYYNANQAEFSIPQSIDVVKFYSKDAKSIENTIKSAGKTLQKGVAQENEVLQTVALNPQIVRDFTQAKIGGFTPIYPIDGQFVTFKVMAKNNPTLLPFENVKNVVIQKMVTQKEDYIIYEYFEKLRSNAKVNIVRLK